MMTCCTTANIKYLNNEHEKKQSIGEEKEIRGTLEANMHHDVQIQMSSDSAREASENKVRNFIRL